jgi:hypothetical protein
MKKSFILLLILTFLVSGSALAAKEEKIKEKGDELTKQEMKILAEEVGVTEDEIQYFPVEVLRSLIEQDAKKISTSKPKKFDLQSEGSGNDGSTSGDIGTMDLVRNYDIEMFGTAYSVNSDRVGYKKIYLYGFFDWLVDPVNKLEDAMSIGYPITNKFFVPTSNGYVSQFSSRNCNKNNEQTWYCDSSTLPQSYDLGTGVGEYYDLLFWGIDHKGYMDQYVYVDAREYGTSNIKLRYGHKKVSGNVGFNVFSYGFAVEPAWNTEYADYDFTLSW